MKKKIFSVILSICLFFGGLFTFSGCSLVSKDANKINNNVVMTIGDKDVTQADLINAFYTYYQNNSNYFSFYDSQTIEESFYTWFTVKTLIDQLSVEALYDAETNPDGYIYYTNKDAKSVWKNVEDYIYSQVSAYEKSIYEADDSIEEKDYPSWIQEDKADDEKKVFEPYTSAVSEIEFTDRKADVTAKLTDEEVFAKLEDVKANLFKYVVSTDDEGNETKEDIDALSKFFKNRNQAYTNYMQNLISSAKANKKSTKPDDVLKAEILRVYQAYYDSQISMIFQNYYMQEYLLNYQNEGDKYTLNDSAVVAAFLDNYYKDEQLYQIEADYITKITSSDGASLILYHYQGQNYFFSVQHILVQFTDYLKEQVEDILTKSTNNTQQEYADEYVAERNQIADDYKKAMLTEINKDALKDSIVVFGDYYYFDENKAEVWDPSNDIYYGYVQLSTHTYNAGEMKLDYAYDTYNNGEEITYESNGVKLMANVDDILEAYETNFDIWYDLASQVFDGSKTVAEIVAQDDGKYESIKYVLETAENLKDCGVSDENVLRNKVASYLFVELEWLYSSDSLANELSNKIGYIISNYPAENGSWVVDFAVGARQIIKDMSESAYTTLSDDEKAIYTKTVVSDYGYHIIKVDNIYSNTAAYASNYGMIDMASVTNVYDLSLGSAYVQEIVGLLKKSYVCSASNQTMYDYFYDKVYENLVGTSSTSGTYFLSLEYNWLNQYYSDKKIETIKHLSYDELIASLS